MKIDPLIRITASGNGEVNCVVFADSMTACRSLLKNYNVRVLREFPFITAFGVHMNVHSLDELSSLSEVRYIGSTLRVYAHTDIARSITGVDEMHSKGIRGKNIAIAVIDTGTRPHLDFCMPRNRLKFVDLVNGERDPYDDNGHGTFVTGVAAGNGIISGGRYKGMAPESNIISIKVMDEKGEGTAFSILEGMQWVYANADKCNIKVCCMSFGSEITPRDPLIKGAEALWRRGVTVVASAGNSGPEEGTIKSPGASPVIITAGAMFDGRGGKPCEIPEFSSKGPCGDYNKPDVVASGVDIVSAGKNDFYAKMSGTSVSAPIVAGISALIINQNPGFSPNDVKNTLIKNASDLGLSRSAQGYGAVKI